jgi:hypothetical protein
MSQQKYPQTSISTTVNGSKSVRKGREHYNQVKAHAKNDRKRHEAYDRLEKYNRLTLTQQLESCVPGGSKRQRARIEAEMVKVVATTPTKKTTKIKQ